VKRLFVMLAVGLLILAVSCDTLNIGHNQFPVRLTASVSHPATMNGGASADWTVSWVGGTGPFSVTLNLGAQADPTTWSASGLGGTSYTHTYTMVNPSLTADAPGHYTATVGDSLGSSATTQGDYTVGPTLNQPPTITGTYDAATKTITATVADADGDPVTVASTATGTITVSPPSDTTAPYVFSVSADLVAGGSGTVTLTADDGINTPLPSWTSATIDIAPVVPDADTIYAVPTKGAVAVDEEDTIVILTGVPAHAFKYMNGVGVTFQGAVQVVATIDRFDPTAGGYYVPGSLNVGAVGGSAWPGPPEAPDGIWATLGTTSFIPAPDDLVNRATDITGGRVRLDLNVTPLDGTESTTASGVLCNFGLKFGAAGTYTLGFQELSVVKRTYYSDNASVEYFWGHYQADETGLLGAGITIGNEITVS